MYILCTACVIPSILCNNLRNTICTNSIYFLNTLFRLHRTLCIGFGFCQAEASLWVFGITQQKLLYGFGFCHTEASACGGLGVLRTQKLLHRVFGFTHTEAYV